ncbi:MAG: hypothetical protein KGL39_16315 [Patescibacteria group bacterium]|nr:hypothetical protein [Patescibacteria group bacterium]
MAADLGALIRPMGFSREKAGEMSATFAKLAVDLSSFLNVSETDALVALRAGIVGEAEPLRSLGVQLSEAAIQQEAYRLRLAKTKNEITPAVKAQAVLSLVLKQTTDAQGDAIRTGDQFANMLRRAGAKVKEAATDLGFALVPAATKATDAFIKMVEPLQAWAQANQEIIAQRIQGLMAQVYAGASRVGEALKEVWRATEHWRDSLAQLMERIKQFTAAAKSAFDRLPKWAQNAILIGGSLAGVSAGLTVLRGKIPIVGAFADSLNDLVNPLKWLGGAVKLLAPLVPVVFSPLGASVAVAAAGVYGLVKAFQAAHAKSESFRDTWDGLKETVAGFVAAVKEKFNGWLKANQQTFDRLADKAEEAFGRLKGFATTAAAWVGEKLSALTGGTIADFTDALDLVVAAADGILDVFERLLDWFNGDGKGLQSIGAGIVAGLQNARASLLEMIAEIIERSLDMLYASIKKVLSWVAPQSFVDSYMQFAEQDKQAITGAIRNRAAALRRSGADFGRQQDEIEQQRNIERHARDRGVKRKKIHQRKQAQQAASDAATSEANAGYDVNAEIARQSGAGVKLGEDIAAGRVKYERGHASEVAQANEQVGQAGEAEPVFQLGGAGARRNVKTLAQNNRAMLQQAGKMGGAQGSAARQAAGVISRLGQQMVEMFAKFDSLSASEQKSAMQLHDTYQELVGQFKAGTLTQEQFNKQVKEAADAAQKLAGAEKELTDEEVARLNARGILTPKQKEQQQAAMQQAGQQVQGAIQQMGQQAADYYKQGQEAYRQQIDEIDKQLGDALKGGDPKQFQAAIDALKGYAQAQIQQALVNVANTGVDVNRTSFGSVEKQGAGAPTDYTSLLAQNPQAAATIKMFEGILAHLNSLKIPHMAEGGMVTSPTYALVGERGPEMVLPMNRLQQWFANPLNIFTGRFGFQNLLNRAGRNSFDQFINPGGMAMNAMGLNGGNLSMFDRLFGNASRILNQQLDLGNGGAQGLLNRWSQVQQQAEDSLAYVRQRRQINLAGNAGWAGNAAGGDVRGHTHLNFNFGHIMMANGTDEQIGSLFDRMEQEALRRGYSMSSNRRNAIGGYTANGRGSPLQPAGQAK